MRAVILIVNFSIAYGETQMASSVQSHVPESSHSNLTYVLRHKIFLFRNADSTRKSLLKALRTHVDEHYPSSSIGVYSTENDSKIAIVIVANKYSPNNYWYTISSVNIRSRPLC